MKVKICGLTSPGEAAYLNDSGADFAGFVLFCPKSRRNITCAQAGRIAAGLRPSIRRVAVTISPTEEQLREIGEAGIFDYIQIHGDFAAERFAGVRLPVLRAYNAGNIRAFEAERDIPQIAGVLFDAAEPGSGKTFDWGSLSSIPRDRRMFILAGGLTPENVRAAVLAVRPDAVDVSSGVEYGPGRPGKDPERVAAFIRAARG